MNEQFRLYYGIVIKDKWYNYSKCEEIKGGLLALLDSQDKSTIGRLRSLIENSVKYVYTDPNSSEPQEEYELRKEDYGKFCMDDSWKFALEIQKQFTGEEKPIVTESFFCPKCSRRSEERYTTIEESWHELIDKGIIDEKFANEPNQEFTTILPVGIVIPDNKTMRSGVFGVLKRRPVSVEEMQRIVKIPAVMENEGLLLCAIWDTQIKSIDGLTERDLNVLKRNVRDPFTRRHITAKEDIDAMSEGIPLGLDAKYRSVSCKYCYNEIGGSLDFTNFFDFVLPNRLSRDSTLGKMV